MDVDIYEPACDSDDVYIDDYYLVSSDGSNCVNLHTYILKEINHIKNVLKHIESGKFETSLEIMKLDNKTKQSVIKAKKRNFTKSLHQLEEIKNNKEAIIQKIKKKIKLKQNPSSFWGYKPVGVSQTYFDATIS